MIRLIDRSGATIVVGSYDTDDVLEVTNSDNSGWTGQDVLKTQTIAQVQEVYITDVIVCQFHW